jgi:hypothetical protein
MPTETRYFRCEQGTVNGLTSYLLALSKAGTQGSLSYTRVGAYLSGELGICVYKRSSDGVETEITGGSPVACVTYYDDEYLVEKSNTWNCPEVSLSNTDSIVIRVYRRIPAGSGTWGLLTNAVFTTEQLGANRLNSATWTVYYVGSFIYDSVNGKSGITFVFDGDYNSRIENFAWTPYTPPPPTIEKKPLMDGFVYVE